MDKLRIATIFSGIGAPEQALQRLGIDYELIFACDNGERIIDIDYDKEYERICAMKSPEEKAAYAEKLYAERTNKRSPKSSAGIFCVCLIVQIKQKGKVLYL